MKIDNIRSRPLIIGADISLYERLREAGATYRCDGREMPLPELLVSKGYTHERPGLYPGTGEDLPGGRVKIAVVPALLGHLGGSRQAIPAESVAKPDL